MGEQRKAKLKLRWDLMAVVSIMELTVLFLVREKVIDRIMQEINAGHQITLNVYGHSRGGIAALLLAKQLGRVDKEKLAINLALLDPVPGNSIIISSIDPFKISLANKTMDLSDCKPLRKVLGPYIHASRSLLLPVMLLH
jgi:hypothetical protein